MADDDQRDVFSDEDDELWGVFAAIQQDIFEGGVPASVVEADARLRDVLFRKPRVCAPHESSGFGSARFALRWLLGRSDGVEAVIDWLGATHALSKKDLKEIRCSGMIGIESGERAYLRDCGLSQPVATILLVLIAFLAGWWVSWVLFAPEPGLNVIASSWVMGGALGYLTRRVLDRSFRFLRLRAKVVALAPWLDHRIESDGVTGCRP